MRLPLSIFDSIEDLIYEFTESWLFTLYKVLFGFVVVYLAICLIFRIWIKSEEEERMAFLNAKRQKPYDPHDKSLCERVPGKRGVQHYPWFCYKGEFYKEGTVVRLDYDRLDEYAANVPTFKRISPHKKLLELSPYAMFRQMEDDGRLRFTVAYQKEDGSFWADWIRDYADVFTLLPEEHVILEIVKAEKFTKKEEKNWWLNWTLGSRGTKKARKSKFSSALVPYIIIASVLVFLFAAAGLGVPAAVIALVGLAVIIACSFC